LLTETLLKLLTEFSATRSLTRLWMPAFRIHSLFITLGIVLFSFLRAKIGRHPPLT
jgi:hypothetical protein